ncbi:MAG: hypothetical protein FWF44_11630 [Defluviitaleaceae bacterium]|nr:hypothetical protein [Defluviitaleaceae bacterium]
MLTTPLTRFSSRSLEIISCWILFPITRKVKRPLDGLLADIKSLEKFPFRNPVYNRPYLPIGKYRNMISAERYRIVYQVDGNFVFVDDIQDCRQADDKNIIP